MTKPRLIISNYDDLHNPYYGGGGATAVHEVAKRLNHHFEVTVLTACYPGSVEQVIDGVLYRRIGISFAGAKLGQVIFQLLLPLYALREHFDLWLETFGPPFSAAFLPLFTKKPVIGLIHMLPALDMQRKYRLPFLPRLVEVVALKVYTRFIALSEDSRQAIRRYNPTATVHIIPNGIKLPARMPILSPQHILFIGRLEINQKGLDLLLYAYKLLLPLHPPPLVIAGSGSAADTTRLHTLITRLELTDQVVLTGRVGGQVKDRLYRQALFVVVPSRFETFSLVVLEGLAYGKALVVFAIPGLSWLPTFCAVKAASLTPLALSTAMAACLTSEDTRRRLSRLARSFAHRFDLDRIAAQFAEVLSSIHVDSQAYWSTSLHPTI